jgi:hypothetical protein
MARAFPYGWRYREALRHGDGAPIGIIYGTQFARRGVCPDDVVYMVAVHRGEVSLLGKVLVDVVTYGADTYRRWVGAAPAPALE